MSSGPYIITKKQDGGFWLCNVPDHDRREDHEASCEYVPAVSLSRRAVATLEPDETALRLFGVKPGEHDKLTDEQADIVNALARLPESGGTITLPDGTVIEVEAVSWSTLGHGSDWWGAEQRILDACNARQS